MSIKGRTQPAITVDERDAIIKALGHSPNSDRILEVAAQFGRGPSTVMKLKQAGRL